MSFDWNLSDDDNEEEDFLAWNTGATRRLGTDRTATLNGGGDDDDDIEARELLPDGTATPFATAAAAATIDPFNDWTNPEEDCVIESGSDDESIGWEDADAAEEDDRKPAASATPGASSGSAVTIDLNQKPSRTDASSQKKRQRRISRLALGPKARELVRNLSRAHLLALVSRTVYLSSLAADETLQAILCSTFPASYVAESTMGVPPTLDQVRQLVAVFANWQTLRNERLRANARAGAPTASRRGRNSRKRKKINSSVTSAQSAPHMTVRRLMSVANYWSDPDPQIDEEGQDPVVVTDTDRVAAFVALARSLHWKARFVSAVDPIPPDASLDVNHPILQSKRSDLLRIFRLVAQPSSSKKSSSLASKRLTKSAVVTSPGDSPHAVPNPKAKSICADGETSDGQCLFCWAEILCTVPADRPNKNASQFRWVHVDPVYQLVHRPEIVESILHSRTKADLSTGRTTKLSANSRSLAVAGKGSRSLPISLSKQARLPLSYTVAVEHSDLQLYRVTDVTPRYASSMLASMRRRSGYGYGSRGAKQNVNGAWWVSTLERINPAKQLHKSPPKAPAVQNFTGGTSAGDAIVLLDDDDDDDSCTAQEQQKAATPAGAHLVDADEAIELEQKTRAWNEAMPTTKAAFATHPAYALASMLGKTQVLHPEAKTRVCGIFKGEVVYRRSDVSVARPANKWLYDGRRVRDEELQKPVKQTKARKKAVSKTNDFQPLASYGVGVGNDGSEEQMLSEIAKGSTPDGDLDDQLQNLYGVWQTDPWTPPTVGPDDPIPVHETYRTIELELLNPGLVHIDQRGLAPIAKQLGIPYAPCHIGFEGRCGRRVPAIRGIVVHAHNSQLLREASVEVISRSMQQDYDAQRDAVNKLWKRLMRGLLVKDRIERDYGDAT